MFSILHFVIFVYQNHTVFYSLVQLKSIFEFSFLDLIWKSALTTLKNKAKDELDTSDSAKLKVIRNRFSYIGEELKSVIRNIFGVCKDDEIETYSNEQEELFEALDEQIAAIDKTKSEG